MVIEQEVSLKPSRYSSVEAVQNLWRERISEDWVNEIISKVDTEQKVRAYAEYTGKSLPDAWASYFSGMFISQI